MTIKTLQKICAWCGTHLPGHDPKAKDVSHGICKPCYEKVRSKPEPSGTVQPA